MNETISLFQAIKQMREISAGGGTFAFEHSTWDMDRRKCNGFRQVRNAHLRPSAREDDVRNSDHKLFYLDIDTNQPRNCWQILLLSFNNQRIVVS